MIASQILAMIEEGLFDDLEVTKKLYRRIEQHKQITSQLIRDHGLQLSERDHFRNYASYVLKQESLNEQDDFIRGLNVPLLVQDELIFRRLV
jgi:hypothetical protein